MGDQKDVTAEQDRRASKVSLVLYCCCAER